MSQGYVTSLRRNRANACEKGCPDVEFKIALEETYVAEFFTVTNQIQIQIQQPTNREGYSDRI